MRWSGWIWSISVAALLVVGHLGTRRLTIHGPCATPTVIFSPAKGIKHGDTKIHHERLQVGEAVSVTIQKDPRHNDAPDLDGPGTHLWIAGTPIVDR